MSWARDSIRPPVRQPYCSLLTAQLHAKLISLGSKTRYADGHVRRLVSARKFVRVCIVEGPAAGGMARRVGLRSRGRPWLVIGFAAAHAVLWTLILINLKAAQDVHMDVAEAFAWGQKFQLGYGKHPPLSGWIAGLWFTMFPVANWATYALAMATLGCGLVICWLIALRVVDRRRAFFVVVMLALYPIFNFKGFKYNPDLLQLVTLPLVVLAYLHAFEKRSCARRAVARACRRAGADDQILGADHDRRDRDRRAASSRSAAVPALAGAMGRDRHAGGRDDSASVVAEAGRFRAADLCRRCLWIVRAARSACSWCSAISATIWRCSPLPVALAALALAWLPRWWTTWRDIRRRCSRAPGRAAPIPA